LPGIRPLPWLTVKTDGQGQFELNNIPPDTKADLIVAASGFSTIYTRKSENIAGYEGAMATAGRRDIRVELTTEGEIEGKVISGKNGQGVAGVELAVIPTFSPTFFERIVCISGEDGTISVSGLQNGEYAIRGDFPELYVNVKSGQKTEVKIEIPEIPSQISGQSQITDSQKINFPKNWDEVKKRAEQRLRSNTSSMKNEVYDCSSLMVTNWQKAADNPNANMDDLLVMRIDEIQKEIQQIVPESWVGRGGEGNIKLMGKTQLLIWQTSQIHKQIRAYLDNKYRELSTRIAIEVRMIIVDAVSIAQAGLKEDPAVGVSVTAPVDSKAVIQLLETKPLVLSDTPAIYTLDDSKAKYVQEVFRQSKGVRQLTAPKAMVINKEPFNLNVMHPVAYMDAKNNQKSVNNGVQLEGFPEITEDGKSVRLAFRLLMTDLIESKDGKPLPSVPVVSATEVQYASVIPDQQTLWLVGPEGNFQGADETASVPPAKRRLLVLIKPTIVVRQEAPPQPQLFDGTIDGKGQKPGGDI
jgi:hypothetical protein